MTAAALILSAGMSRRFGSPKVLAELDGRPLLAHVVSAAIKAELAPIAIVVGHEQEAVRHAIDDTDILWVANPIFAQGQASSLRVGLRALSLDLSVEAAVVLLGDEPGISSDAVAQVATTCREHQRRSRLEPRIDAVRARYLDGPGHPVAFPRRSWWSVHEAAAGDEGARRILARGRVIEIPFRLPRPLDVDHPHDLQMVAVSTAIRAGGGEAIPEARRPGRDPEPPRSPLS